MKWDLTEIYSDFEKWDEDFDLVSSKIESLSSFKGLFVSKTSNELPVDVFNENLFNYLTLQLEISNILEKLYSYAFLYKDTNMNDEKGFELLELVSNLSTKISSVTSSFEPEILTHSYDDFISLISKDVRCNRYLLKVRSFLSFL